MTPLARALSALKRLKTRANAKAACPEAPSVSNETRQGPASESDGVPGTLGWYDAQEARWWFAGVPEPIPDECAHTALSLIYRGERDKVRAEVTHMSRELVAKDDALGRMNADLLAECAELNRLNEPKTEEQP